MWCEGAVTVSLLMEQGWIITSNALQTIQDHLEHLSVALEAEWETNSCSHAPQSCFGK